MSIVALIKAMPASIAQGLIWGVMALGVYVTYKILDFADLTVDGSFCTGGAVAAMLIIGGMDPTLALLFSFIAGMAAGLVTGVFHTRLGIPPILAGILTQLALYSINMRIMGKATQSISVNKYTLTVSLRHVPQSILVGIIFVGAVVAVLFMLVFLQKRSVL